MRTPWTALEATITANDPVDPSMHHLVLQAPDVAATAGPGQFVTLALPGAEPLLPRPFDLHYADSVTGQIEIIFRVKGRGTQLLAALPPGGRLQLQGPFGNHIGPLLGRGKKIAVIGRGAGISPLYFIARFAFDEGAKVTAYISARSQALLAPFLGMQEVARVLGCSDELQPGYLVTDRFAQDVAREPVDLAFVVGSQRLARAALALGERHGFPVYGFAESYMPCGFGHCKACAIPTRNGYVLACMSGPVIDLGEVRDDYWSVAPR